MLIDPQKRWAWPLLTGFAMLTLAPKTEPAIGSQPSTQNADQARATNRAPDPAEGAAGEARAATSQPSEPGSAAPDDQATPDPDCPQADLAATDDERHLIDDPYGQAFTGARDGKVKLVMFIDYGCPACRNAQPLLDRLVAEDPGLEVVYRIVDNEDGSTGVSGVSIEVARSKGDWQAFHHALDAGDSVSDEAIAKALDAAHLKKSCYLPSASAATNDVVLDELQRNRQFLFERKLQNFPSWVIGRGPVRDDMDYATLKAAIAKASARGS